MAFGEGGDRASRAIFERLADEEQGARLAHLVTTTIRAVAQGVIGVAFIQALVIGICLLVAGVPGRACRHLVLVLGIAQVPALLVTLPVVAYLWVSADYGTVAAMVYTVLLLFAGMIDNVLKPLMLGHGVDAPMPVILLGALSGMAAAGILGMFVGATLLAPGYRSSWAGRHEAEDTAARAGPGPRASGLICIDTVATAKQLLRDTRRAPGFTMSGDRPPPSPACMKGDPCSCTTCR